eukprot:63818-Prymnesium_polylepis.1
MVRAREGQTRCSCADENCDSRGVAREHMLGPLGGGRGGRALPDVADLRAVVLDLLPVAARRAGIREAVPWLRDHRIGGLGRKQPWLERRALVNLVSEGRLGLLTRIASLADAEEATPAVVRLHAVIQVDGARRGRAARARQVRARDHVVRGDSVLVHEVEAELRRSRRDHHPQVEISRVGVLEDTERLVDVVEVLGLAVAILARHLDVELAKDVGAAEPLLRVAVDVVRANVVELPAGRRRAA